MEDTTTNIRNGLHFPIWQQMSKDILNEIMKKVEINLLILT